MSAKSAEMFRPRRRSRTLAGPLFAAACLLATLTGVVVLAVLVLAVVAAALSGVEGGPDVAGAARELYDLLARLISNRQSSDPARAGFRVGIVSSLWLLALTAAIGIPLGVGAGVFLEEYMPDGRLRRLVQTNIANLAGVPSVVYGILGLAVFARGFGYPGLALGPTLLAGALTLSLLILPTIVITTQESLRTVPPSLRQAALALGATRWQVVSGHVLPSALPGILTGMILGLSRAVGETAPLLMVGAAGSLLRAPGGPFDRYTAMPVEIYNYAKEPGQAFQPVTAGGILILVALLLSMNAVAIVIRNRYGRR
ncbi:phosphate ABC transporter permease PstA [Paludisphaera sp.]|uniref:phosphate ABC transporter permease PstA n=1 Tax=Paludisphaera sp. TaxID=2017432 RepID=UPI00301C11FF